MRCAKAKRKISLYLEGELEENERKELLSHLDICVNCSEEMKSLSFMLSLIEKPKEIQPSPYFILKVKQKIKEQETRGPLLFPSLRWMLKPLTVCLGLMVMLSVGNYLGKNIWKSLSQPQSMAEQEIKTIMGLTIFDDIPGESFEMVYNNLLRGDKK